MEKENVLNGRYRILRPLGNEGSRTYLALDKNFNREVVLVKTSAEETAAGRLSLLFDDPCVVKILNRFSENGETFLVLEYVHGSTFKEYLALKKEPMTKEAAWKMLRPAAKTLERARENGIPHGMPDPAHFLVQEDGTLKILGLGMEEGSSGDASSKDDAAMLYAMLCSLQKKEAEPKNFQSIKELTAQLEPPSEEKKAVEKKKIRPVFIWLPIALAVCLAAVGFSFFFRQAGTPSAPTVVYAGNEIRGTEAYRKFTAYVREHAVSQEKVETDGVMKGGISYTLKPSDIYAWGAPCNERRLDIKRDAFISGLQKEGVQVTKVSEDDTDSNEVMIGEYGMINTYFLKRTDYRLGSHACMSVKSDMINDDVMRIYFYWEDGCQGSDEELGRTAADAVPLLTKDWNGDREKTGRMLGEELTYTNAQTGEEPEAFYSRDVYVGYGEMLGDKNGIRFSYTFSLGMKDGNFTYF